MSKPNKNYKDIYVKGIFYTVDRNVNWLRLYSKNYQGFSINIKNKTIIKSSYLVPLFIHKDNKIILGNEE